ncbi:unnamed protein product [Ambrosiozyma monospora]|uniref:Protein-serine/threonine kinase n=1 Tax=Ambrosiozyma monospora TaxID=43982 RepID=A0A9W6Z4K8_AMBMO|nr:unnamed protein product [Ambrosiozyma monospora]
MEQHISLSRSFLEQEKNGGAVVLDKSPDFVGLVFQTISAHDHLKLMTSYISVFLQTQYPGIQLPELIIEGKDVQFQFMKSHINYIFAEILRNALKSTLEQFVQTHKHLTPEQLSQIKPPPIKVQIINSKREVEFVFSDQGGGIPRERVDKIWSFGKNPIRAAKYLHTFHRMPGLDLTPQFPILDHQYTRHGAKVAPAPNQHQHDPIIKDLMHNLGSIDDAVVDVEQEKSTLKSLVSRPFEFTLGVSLPMCKVYTDYWNGDLNMCSVEGYGTDVYLKLSKLGMSLDHRAQLDRA